MKIAKKTIDSMITLALLCLGGWFIWMAFEVQDNAGMALFMIYGFMCIVIPGINYLIRRDRERHYMNIKSDLERLRR